MSGIESKVVVLDKMLRDELQEVSKCLCFVSDIFCFDFNSTLTHNLCTFATINKTNLLI